MFFFKIYLLLLFHAALSNKVWHVYVDFELSKVIELQYSMTNMISAIIQTSGISCPYITQDTAQTISFPCAFLQSVIPVTDDAQPDHAWTVTCPQVLWIELNIITLDLPLSGPQCTDGYVAFLNLLGEPPDVKYCGRKPREILYAQSRLTITIHIQRLRSEVMIDLKYQYTTKQLRIIHQRMPYSIMYSKYFDAEIKSILLMEIPYHSLGMTGTVKYHVMCIPDEVQEFLLKVTIDAEKCNYIVYDGPGIDSPQIGNSSTLGMTYSVLTDHPMFFEYWGSMELCQFVTVQYIEFKKHVGDVQTFYSYTILQGFENNEPIQCSNASYRLINGHGEFHVQSSEEHNVWCPILFHNEYDLWNFALEMDFYGPNILFQDAGRSTCQFGGVYFHRNENARAICEPLSLQRDNYYTYGITAIYIRFYTGYSSGRVKLKILKTPFPYSSLNKYMGMECYIGSCAGSNMQIWHSNSIGYNVDGSIHEETKYIFHDIYPEKYKYFIDEPLNGKHFHIHISAGKEDGTVMLGLVHFVLFLQCSGHSICSTQCVIGFSTFSPNFTQSTYIYEQSVAIDEHIEYTRLIDVSIDVSDLDDVELKIILEKVQHCDDNVPDVHAQQLAFDECDFITLKNTVGYATFFTQILQGLTIGLDPACPVKECVDINVKATPLCACSPPFEWKNTALEHVPIIVNTSYAITSLTWTQSAQCSADFHSVQHLCDIWMQVDVRRLVLTNILVLVVKYDDYLTVPVTANTDQLYGYKM